MTTHPDLPHTRARRAGTLTAEACQPPSIATWRETPTGRLPPPTCGLRTGPAASRGRPGVPQNHDCRRIVDCHLPRLGSTYADSRVPKNMTTLQSLPSAPR